MTLRLLDYIVVLVYLGAIAGIGLYMSRAQKSTRKYFIADRKIPAWAVAFTLMGTLISSATVVGHPGTVFQKGMILLPGILTLPLVFIFVAFFIVPFYRRVIGLSAYEYIGKRFGFGGRLYTSFGFLADRIFDLGITLLTTAIAINVMTGWDLKAVIIGVGVFTMIYTAIGGIEAVVWTDVVQGIILIGSALLIVLRLVFAPEAGPPGAVIGEAMRAGKLSIGSSELSWGSLFDVEVTTAWIYMVAFTLIWSRIYITDQHMVQRYLIAKTDREAFWGVIWGAASCLPIFITFMFIGACLFGFYSLTGHTPPEIGDNIVPHFIVNFLPTGIVGLILAAVMAAAMSSVSGDLNSVATVITEDYIGQFLPKTSDRTRLIFARSMVLLGGILSSLVAILLIPKEGSASIMERGIIIAVVLSAGTLGLFLLGFLTRKATRRGAYCGIVACLLFTAWGVLTGPEFHLWDLGDFNFNMNPILLGALGHVVVFVVGYTVSIIFGGHRPDDIDNLVFRIIPK